MRDLIFGALIFYYSALCLSIVSPPMFSTLMVSPVDYIRLAMHNSYSSNQKVLYDLYPLEKEGRKSGVTISIPDKIWGDYFFYIDDSDNIAKLIDVDGTIIHEWDFQFSRKWGDLKHLVDPSPVQHVEANRIFLAPEMNGDAYALYYSNADAFLPYYGLIKVDKYSNVLWKYEDNAHHDIEFLGDNKIISFVSYLRNENHPDLPHIVDPVYYEYLVWLDSKTGEELRRVDIVEAFAKSEYASMLTGITGKHSNPDLRPGDIFHGNTITKIPDYIVGKAPMLKSDSVLLSIRNLDMLAIMDLREGIITWAAYGPWRGQHSPKFLDNGHVVMFDNMGHLTEGGMSRVLEVDLNDLSIVWEYSGDEDTPFASKYSSMLFPLPNQNVIVFETIPARVFEVSRDKEIVWEYLTPSRFVNGENRHIPNVSGGGKFLASDLTFLNNEVGVDE